MFNTAGLQCFTCDPIGGICASPTEHLANENTSSLLLTADTPLENYAEVNKWGRRWRVMNAYVKGGTKPFVDDMGAEDDYLIGGFMIPSAGNEVWDWNTLGECMDIALWQHDEHREGFKRKRVPAATVQQWAEELEQQREFVHKWMNGVSTYGVGGHVQRAKDWVR